MPSYIEREWLSYRKDVMHPDSPPVQLVETRRAFYAGAQSFLSVVMERLDDDREPTDDDLRMMDDIYEELQQFARDVGDGRK